MGAAEPTEPPREPGLGCSATPEQGPGGVGVPRLSKMGGRLRLDAFLSSWLIPRIFFLHLKKLV